MLSMLSILDVSMESTKTLGGNLNEELRSTGVTRDEHTLTFPAGNRNGRYLADQRKESRSPFLLSICLYLFMVKSHRHTKSGIPGWFLNKIGYLFFATGRAYARLQNASKTRSGA